MPFGAFGGGADLTPPIFFGIIQVYYNFSERGD